MWLNIVIRHKIPVLTVSQKAGEHGDLILRGVESICYDGKGINWIVLFFERRSRSDCVHEQVAKRIANVRFTKAKI